MVTIRFEEAELMKVFQRMKKFLAPISPIFLWFAKRFGQGAMRNIGRFFLIDPSNSRRLAGDVGFIVSEKRVGIAWLGKQRRRPFCLCQC